MFKRLRVMRLRPGLGTATRFRKSEAEKFSRNTSGSSSWTAILPLHPILLVSSRIQITQSTKVGSSQYMPEHLTPGALICLSHKPPSSDYMDPSREYLSKTGRYSKK